MRIKNWDLREFPDVVEVSADIDDFRLWYRLPRQYSVSKAGDPFLAAALLPAMAKGESLEVEPGLTVSPMLVKNLALLQEIHHSWNPALKLISISAETAPAKPVNEGSFSFFSGGLDGMFTFIKRRSEISHVVSIHGFDFFDDRDAFRTAVERRAAFAAGFGKTLIPVETNFYPFGYHHNLSRILTQGSTLAGVALLLGFPRAFIPSSYHYARLVPYGSHPLTDPLYSNESMKIIHDGAEARRIDKLTRVVECEAALDALTVCLEDMNVNCGRCCKCVRTMTSLELLGLRPASFPWPLSFKAIKRMDWSHELILIEQNIELAVRRNNKKIERVLRACLRRYERLRLLKDADRVFLGGIVKKAFRIFSKGAPTARRIDVVPPKE